MSKHIITKIDEDSIAKELEIQVGDELLTINGQAIDDVLDYKYLEKDEELELVIYRESTNEEWEYFIEKEVFDEIGLEFESGLMDEYKSCTNKCVFCFIDQLPPGMRETMYFKDDDARLSFLQGNYITLTNMKEKDFNRIIEYRLSPINVSIHSMNMDLRREMLHNKFAGDLIEYLDRLYEAGIVMNGQIVLCKGINDGAELEYSIQEMMKYMPFLQSVSIVPVGLTKFRDHLEKLEPFNKEEAKEIIDLVHKYQKQCMEKEDLHFIHAGDEFYFLAEEEVPEGERYDGYIQYENGVGMTRLLKDEFEQCYNNFDFQSNYLDDGKNLIGQSKVDGHSKEEDQSKVAGDVDHDTIKRITIVTGRLMEKPLADMADRVMKKVSNVNINILGVENEFFGPRITVSGLVTGQDILKQISGIKSDVVYIPDNMLKADEDIFLDNVTVNEMQKTLQCKVIPLPLKGDVLMEAMAGKEISNEK